MDKTITQTDHTPANKNQAPRPAAPMTEWLIATVILSAPVALVMFGLHLFAGLATAPAWIGGLIITVALGLFSRPLLRDIAGLRQYAALATHLAKPPPPPRLSAAGLTLDLRGAVSRLIAVWRDDHETLAADIEALQTVLDRLPDPVFMLSAELSILQANQAAKALLPESLHQAGLSSAFRNPDLLETAALALAGETPRETEIELAGPPRRVYRVWIARLPKPLNNGVCALLRMVDQTEVKRTEQLHADFIANASHELKTPLATLTGYIETLQDAARQDAGAIDRFLAVMEGEAQRMGRLVQGLLSLSRIERQEHERPQDRADLRERIGAVVDLISPLAKQNGQELVIELPDDATVIGDSDQLTQVFLNLADNAVKYAPPGRPIRIVGRHILESGRRLLSVAVIDQGEGIEGEHLPRLTERFYRVDAARSRALGGTGLGLAIVKHILTRHAGRLDIRSAPGEGSIFTAVIPAADAYETTDGNSHEPDGQIKA